MRLKKGFVLRKVCGENVIVGEGLGAIDFGKLLCLNETATWLWEQANEMDEFEVESLSNQLCENYDVTPEEAKRDVIEILNDWRKVGVIE